MRLTVLCFVILVGGCAGGPGIYTSVTTPAAPDGHADAAFVVRVVDGDTIVVRLAGARTDERVRLIGIQAPETGAGGNRAPECGGEDASRVMHGLADGRSVSLAKDVEDRDQFGRLLRYAYRDDGLFLNAEIVREGWAYTFRHPPSTAHADELAALQKEARAAKRGLWTLCPE